MRARTGDASKLAPPRAAAMRAGHRLGCPRTMHPRRALCTPNADGWCALTTAAELVGPQDAAGSFFYPGTEPVQIDL